MDDRPLPPGPAGSPITGNLTEYTEDPLGFLLRCAQEHGDVVRLSRGSFLVSHPELVRRVLHDKEGTFEKKDPVRRRNHSAFPASVMNSAGQDWQDKKRSLQPAFQPAMLGEALERSASALDAFIEAWLHAPPDGRAALPHADTADTDATTPTGGTAADASAIDVRQSMQCLCMDMGSAALLGMPLQSDESARILQTIEAVMVLTRSPVRLPAFFPTPANLRLRRARADLDASLAQIIARYRNTSPRPHCLLGTLLEHGTGTDASAWLRDELATMVMSGLEPMADALTWTLHLLSLHGGVQQHSTDTAALGIGKHVEVIEPAFAKGAKSDDAAVLPRNDDAVGLENVILEERYGVFAGMQVGKIREVVFARVIKQASDFRELPPYGGGKMNAGDGFLNAGHSILLPFLVCKRISSGRRPW